MNRSKPLTAKVYQQVYSDIINGKITADDVITEGQLIQQLGVSKSPVREALVALCNENILRSIPRMGYMVVQITPEEIGELAEARRALEVFMLQKSFARLTDEMIDKLEAMSLASLEDSRIHTSPMDNWQRNMKFHLRLASFAQNKIMYDLLENTLRMLTRATTQYFMHIPDRHNPLTMERSSGSRHFQLIEACRDRNLYSATRILERDIDDLKQ